MRTKEQIEEKIDEINSEIDDLETEKQEVMEEEGVDDTDEKGERIELEFEDKKKVFENQIELLDWVLEE